jgi:hypothetical protein
MKAIGLTRYLPISDPQSLVDVEIAQPEPAAMTCWSRWRQSR